MSKFEYKMKMAYAVFWFHVWTVWEFLRLPEFRKDNTMNSVLGWIVSQCGFMYMGNWKQCQDFYKNPNPEGER